MNVFQFLRAKIAAVLLFLYVLMQGMPAAIAHPATSHQKRVPSFDYPYPISQARVAAEKLVNEGLSKVYQQDIMGAIATLSQATIVDPTDEMAYRYLGDLYCQTQNWQAAIAAYSNAIHLNPEFSRLYNSRGLVYLEQQDYENAIADFAAAIAVYPEDPIGYYNRGIAYTAVKNYPQALANFWEAIGISDDYADAYIGRGKVRQALANFKGATADFLTAADLLQTHAELLCAQDDEATCQHLQTQRQSILQTVDALKAQATFVGTPKQTASLPSGKF